MYTYDLCYNINAEENDFHVYGKDIFIWEDHLVEKQLMVMEKVRKDEAFRQKTDVYDRLNPDGSPSPFLQVQKKGSEAAGYKRDPVQGYELVKV